MRELPDNITFERWVEHVFDHAILSPQWWFQPDDSEHIEEWNEEANPVQTLAFLTRLFLNPRFLIKRYNRPQIDQGLNYLVSPPCSSHMFVLANRNLPWETRRACIAAMATLYRDLMAPVYGWDLGHAEQSTNPERPTFGCYMWWDVIPLDGDMKPPDRDRINDAVLDVFRQTLQLREEACLESVLHGLGHWHLYIPERTEPIVREFLAQRNDISDALRDYAKYAAVGGVQ